MHLQGWRLHHLSRQPLPEFDHPYSKKVVSYVLIELLVFLYVSIASCAFTGYHREKPNFLYRAASDILVQ